MKCPICHIMLAAADRQGIEIDYCPKCWGVWLDRGELNALIERSAGMPVEDESPESRSHVHSPNGTAASAQSTAFWKDMFDFQ